MLPILSFNAFLNASIGLWKLCVALVIENLKDSSQNQKWYKMILKFAILKCPEFKKSYMNFFFLNGCAHGQFFSCDHLQKYFLLSNGLWWEQFDLFYHGKP